MSKQLLLVEHSTSSIQKLNESSDSNNKYVFEGVFTELGTENRNGRIYTESVFLPHMKKLQESIKKNSLLGELDHPKEFETSLKNASHIIESIEYDESSKIVKGRIRLLDTEAGKNAKAIADAGVPLHISSRACGSVSESNKEVKIDKLFTYDLVADPGFKNAVLSSVNESYGISNSEYSNFFMYDISSNSNVHESSLPIKNNLLVTNDFNEHKMFYENQISKLEEKIVNLEMKRNQGRRKLSESSSSSIPSNYLRKIDKLVSDVEALKEWSNHATDNVNAFEKWSDHVTETVSALEKWSDGATDEVRTIKSWINEATETVTALEKWSDDATNEVRAMKSWINEATDTVTALEKWSDDATNEMNAFSKWSDGATNHINAFEKWSDSATNEMNSFNKWSDDATNHINAFEKWSDHVTESVSLLEGDTSYSNKVGLNENFSKSFKKDRKIQESSTKYKRDIYSKIDELISESKQQKEDVRKVQSLNESNNVQVVDNRPMWLKAMPNKYNFMWENLDPMKKESIKVRANMYAFNDRQSILEFWNSTFGGQSVELLESSNQIQSNNSVNESSMLSNKQLSYINAFNSSFRK